MKLAILLSILCLALECASAASDSTITVRKPPLLSGIWWTGSVGVGKSASRSGAGRAGAVTVAVRDRFLLTYRMSTAGASFPNERGSDGREFTAEHALMIGCRTIDIPNAWLSISAGLAYVNTKKRGALLRSGTDTGWGWFGDWYHDWEEHEFVRQSTIGVPLELQMVYSPVSTVGIGLSAMANLNLIRPTVIFGASLLVGLTR